jgi:hypothetical protein
MIFPDRLFGSALRVRVSLSKVESINKSKSPNVLEFFRESLTRNQRLNHGIHSQNQAKYQL